MLRLMGWLRKISLIGLIAAVLTPFVLRPFLTMGISAHHVTLVKTFTQPCPVKHQPCGLICQLDSQTREIDTRPENASEFLSLRPRDPRFLGSGRAGNGLGPSPTKIKS